MDILRQKIFDDWNEQIFLHRFFAQAFSGFNFIDCASVRGDRVADAASFDLVKWQTIQWATGGNHDCDAEFGCFFYRVKVASADAAFVVKKRSIEIKRNEFDIFHIDTFLNMS